MEVEFCNLSYTATNYVGTKKTILENVSGKFLPGQLCAILGPSGAGKTSLLHAISGYRSKGVTGELLTNGEKRNHSDFRRHSCYITQEDQLPPFMTVKEAMMMAANLKLSQSTSTSVKTTIVYDILSQLRLQEHHHTKTENLSGGQKKRVSVALELINNPSVFFLDEPTSGLDNVSTVQCLKILQLLAKEGRTIVCTIHQPVASQFLKFSQVYVVAKGQCVYQGAPKNVVPFLSSYGYECPLSYNPADFIIELTDGDNTLNINTLSNAVQNGKLCIGGIETDDEQHGSHYAKNKKVSITSVSSVHSWIKLKSQNQGKVGFPTSGWYQFWILLRRMWLQTFRNKKGLAIQAFHYIMCGGLLGLIYFRQAEEGEQMNNHIKFCVGVVLFFAHTRMFIPILLFPQEVKLAKKEHFNRWYGTTPYFFAANIATIPLPIFYNAIYAALTYFMCGLPNDLWRFGMYYLIANMVALSTEGIGLAIGSIFKPLNGSVVGPNIIVVFLGLQIYGIDFPKQIPWFMKMSMRTSPMRCGLVALLLVLFGFDRPKLNCSEVYCHWGDPRVMLNFLDFKDSDLYLELASLVVIILFYRIIAYISLRIRFAT